MYALFIWIAEYRFSKEITVLFLGRYDTIFYSFFYCEIYFLYERNDEKATKKLCTKHLNLNFTLTFMFE